ncbi:MAG: 3-dehydroquinate synthase [Deltaproteobacteria bacterium]|nr:3-dehydroquinate synthase [Deltaproteobacteria bacterium]
MDSIKVNLGDRSYPIYFGTGILKGFGGTYTKFSNSKKVIIVTNPNVGKLYYEVVEDSLLKEGIEPHRIDVPDGEEYKTLTWASKLFDKLIALKADRQTPLIALGGGVIGDLTGFVAATYLRGVPFIQVPTTLLAQVDSSVGGKTGVNHRKGKNLIGAFYQPKFVYIDIDTLKSLDKREIKAGLAEVIKYGVIRDPKLFKYLEDNVDILTQDLKLKTQNTALLHIVKRSCAIKAAVVEADERESGLRAILNFGHTFGHAVEAVTKYKEYKHGEAVAIGMVYASKLSHRTGLCSKSVVERVRNLIKKAGLPTEAPNFPRKSFLKAMEIDKKVVGGELRFVLVEGIGKVRLEKVKADVIMPESRL